MQEIIHDAQRLKELQALPLERKIQISQTRIIEWYQHWKGNVVVSYSGGKDSTVLLHMVRQLYPDVPAVFCNTGLEYPEIQKFAREQGATFVTPTMRFDEVVMTYGYPLIGKEVAEAIHYARRIRNGEREREHQHGANQNSSEPVRGAIQTDRQTDRQTDKVLGNRPTAKQSYGKQSERKRKELQGLRIERGGGENRNPQPKDHLIQTSAARNRRTVLYGQMRNGTTTNRESGAGLFSMDDSEPG